LTNPLQTQGIFCFYEPPLPLFRSLPPTGDKTGKVKTVFRADPTLSPPDRVRLLALLRHGADAAKAPPASANSPRLLTRRATGSILSKSLRTVDKLAATGVLPRRFLPGRVRAAGFLDSDVFALLQTDRPATFSSNGRTGSQFTQPR
jgi:hypothetical protein